MSDIVFYTDENIPEALVAQLRERDIEVIRFVDVYELGTDDEIHLSYAMEHGLVVVTRDDDFFRLQDLMWKDGIHTVGVVRVNPRHWQDIGRQLQALLNIHENETSEGMMNQQRWI